MLKKHQNSMHCLNAILSCMHGGLPKGRIEEGDIYTVVASRNRYYSLKFCIFLFLASDNVKNS
uniref:Uncharacterized protein n=1 Tax=Anguilla anguilla TaxID=7936 RepID=A0A0E9WQ70_ANGAN